MLSRPAEDRLSRNCPYLDTIDRSVLDFDFEKLCSVSLLNNNVYACLVCGKYFQGTWLHSNTGEREGSVTLLLCITRAWSAFTRLHPLCPVGTQGMAKPGNTEILLPS